MMLHTSPALRFRHPGVFWPVILAILLIATPGIAQERFSLGDDDEWKAGAAPEPGTPAGELAEIRRLIAGESYGRAEKLATRWIEQHETHPLRPEAYLARADARILNDDEYEALYDLEIIARLYPSSDVFVDALERELTIARLYADGLNRKQWGIRMFSAVDEAEELFIRVQERLPGSSLAEQAGIALAEFYFDSQQMDLAADAYELFMENYPRSIHVPVARRRLIYAHLAAFKGPRFDASGLYEARALLEQLQRIEPVTAKRVGAEALKIRIDESDANKILETARWYIRTGNPISAELLIRRLINTYPASVAAEKGVALAVTLLPNLPQSVIDEAPDYRTLQAALEAARAEAEAMEAAAVGLISKDNR